VRRVNGQPTSALMLQDGTLHDCNLSLALTSMLDDEGYNLELRRKKCREGWEKCIMAGIHDIQMRPCL